MLNSYILSTCFTIIILGLLVLRSFTAIRQKHSRMICCVLIGTTALYVLFDSLFIACHLSQAWGVKEWKVISFLFFVVYVALPFVWHLFFHNFVGRDTKQWVRIIELIPLVFLLGLVVLTPSTGALYYFDSDGMYTRGPLYAVFTYLNYFYYIEPIFYLAIYRKNNEHYVIHGITISLIPLVGAAINDWIIPVGTIFPFQPYCSTVVAMLAFFFIASKDSDRLKDLQQQSIEEALARSEEASNIKTAFLSNMSHDIRTPMNAIINLTDLALEESDVNVIHSYLGDIKESNEFLLGLINEVLDMSRIETGNIQFHREPLTRTEFLNTIDAVISPLVKSKRINYHAELNPGEYTIFVDKTRFYQIFFNLLSNAVKYTPDGGDVWFEVHNMEQTNDKLRICFIVRDNGVGMSEEFLKHIFEPFAREESDYNIKIHGTGLGLSIVKGLIDKLGGTIFVKSKLGEGTEFTVLFDVAIISKNNELVKPSETDDGRSTFEGLSVLLVEDNELNAYVARTILTNAGVNVTVAQDGEKAVEAFTQEEPFSFDAIFMDIRMPVMNGIDATKAIRDLDREDAKTIPIIAMTADVFENEHTNFAEVGFTDYLPKPIKASKVYSMLNNCVPPPPPTKNEDVR